MPYQRYLGWRVAANLEADILIYFDDDQRIHQQDLLEWLVKPLQDKQNDVVGVGCYSRVPESRSELSRSHSGHKKKANWLVQQFGSRTTLGLKPGQLTPSGHRIGLVDEGQNYISTDWLYGRIMVYRVSAMSVETFSDDLFAVYHVRRGRGEDTFLSRQVGARGKLLFTFRAVVDHPNADAPVAYPNEAFKFAYAGMYSRRLLNDNYRVFEPTTVSDRWALVKSYLGNVLLSWMRILSQPTKTNLALARGTTMGAIHGLIRPPTARRLTPDIDWWADADKAVANAVTIQAPDVRTGG